MQEIEIKFNISTNTSSEEKERIKKYIINLGWKLGSTSHYGDYVGKDLEIVSGFSFHWDSDSEIIYPENIEYSIATG